MNRTLIKFCGCTSPLDVEEAAAAGADAVGLIFAPSPRRIGERIAGDIARALPAGVRPVGVFANPTYDDVSRLRELFDEPYVQLSGNETPAFVSSLGANAIKTIHVDAAGDTAQDVARRGSLYATALLLLDTRSSHAFGGSGLAFDWQIAAALGGRRPIVVAGGLTPQNVAACVRTVRPFGVDVRSGVETAGRKDRRKMREFVQAVRSADAN
jgi:phosphoribosylanthranilate isomerase